MNVDDIFELIKYDDTDETRYELDHECCGNCRYRREGIAADTCIHSVEQIRGKDVTWNIVVEDHAICKFYVHFGV
jgi:hypothetical protein